MTSIRKKKRGNYSREDLVKAVYEYKNGATSSEVTTKYNVPGSTVRNHKCNPKKRIGGGRPTLLTNHQEQYLVELLKNLEVNGIRLTKPLVMQLASEYIQLVTG
jgi:transposase